MWVIGNGLSCEDAGGGSERRVIFYIASSNSISYDIHVDLALQIYSGGVRAYTQAYRSFRGLL